ncbi:reverse transcriptase [Gossypium australe]|uniref:Reverse transcriptase n=1 Tax=Gossypium australe TaxID=47621 RepID=A0A5B6UR57_9ROSI|nr:reverse transcriptase [Gossypium australe]
MKFYYLLFGKKKFRQLWKGWAPLRLPISLCTVIYKVVAKAIANQLQKVIDKCIDRVQSAFVPGQLITDNVLLAYEILHTIRQKHT